MDIFETYVPPAERGNGHAKRLAKAGFAVAHAYGWLVRPSRSYIADTFLADTPTIQVSSLHTYKTHTWGSSWGCDELLLFPCCPDGKDLEPRRRSLAQECVLEATLPPWSRANAKA